MYRIPTIKHIRTEAMVITESPRNSGREATNPNHDQWPYDGYQTNNPKSGSYPVALSGSGECQGGKGRMILATT
jgi:hypothetical protein